MQTIQIDNPEIEHFISSRYGGDTQNLLSDFVKFVKLSLDDGYKVITKDEAIQRVSKAVKEVRDGKATFLNQEDYDQEIDGFIKTL